MRYRITIKGTEPLLQHNGAANLDTHSPVNQERDEIVRRLRSDRTVSDERRLAELECQLSLWLDEHDRPTIPHAALRTMLETSAKKLKQGPRVREGLMVTAVEHFAYDEEQYGTTRTQLGKTTQFRTAVVVNRNRMLRTRAKFDEWACTFVVECDDAQVDSRHLKTWLEIGGRRIGLGDWRPERSGTYGRFEIQRIEPLRS